ncbi:hypothetical protein LCGC14_2033150, partial [marine sediment metagenome]
MKKENDMRNLNTKASIFTLLLCTMLIGWVDPASDKNEEGIQLYNEEKPDEAISKFTDAQSYAPESQSLDFNIANTHYKEGKFPEAEKSFKDVMKTKDNTLKAKANYNLGNTMYKQGKFKEALDFYKKTIELTEEEKSNLKDKETASIREDAKYNYEFVQKKMEEMQKEQQERQEQEKQEQEQQQEEQEKDKQQSEKEDPDQQEQQDKQAKGEKNEQMKEPPQENEMEEPPPL